MQLPTLARNYHVADSIALYANGDLFFRGTRIAVAVEPKPDPDTSKMLSKATPQILKTKTKDDCQDDAVNSASATVSDNPVLFFGQNSVVTVVVDTSLQGGTMSFELDGAPVKFCPVSDGPPQAKDERLSSFSNMFDRLGSAAAVFVCTFLLHFENPRILEVASKNFILVCVLGTQ